MFHFSMDAAYSCVFSFSPAPTRWLIIIDAPITIEKQNDIVVQTGDETLLRALIYILSICPKNARSISICTWEIILLRIIGTAIVSKGFTYCVFFQSFFSPFLKFFSAYINNTVQTSKRLQRNSDVCEKKFGKNTIDLLTSVCYNIL